MRLEQLSLLTQRETSSGWTGGELIRKSTQNNEAYKQSNIYARRHNSKRAQNESFTNKHMQRYILTRHYLVFV